jgi:putative ABC transport system permease protein
MEKFAQDLKYAFRSLRSKPGLLFIALLTLALGIGANTALFSILYATLWKPLPYHDASRLAIIWETNKARDQMQNVTSPANYGNWLEQNQVFEDIAAFAQTGSVNITGNDQPEQVSIQYASPNLFRVLGVKPALGRTFRDGDGIGEDRTVILSNGLWRRRFGADPLIAGKEIHVNGRKALVAGVMPQGWNWFVKEGSMFGKPPEVWMAFPITPELRQGGGRYLTVVGRLKPGITIQKAQANMNQLAEQAAKERPEYSAGWNITVTPLREQFSGSLRKPLWVLAGAVGFVLLIACSNVANLMLARAISRSREMALRTALGAGRLRLIRQLLTESVLLSVAGGLAGLALAVWGTQALALLGQRASIDFASVELNSVVLAFAFGLSVLTGLLFGIVPSVMASAGNVQEQLKEGSKGATDSRTGKLRNVLVSLQFAIALLLLAGAGLLIQSFWRLSSENPGFDSKHVLTFRLVLPGAKYPEDVNRIQFFRTLMEKLRTQPGINSAGMISYLPFGGPTAGTTFHIQGIPDPPPEQKRVTNVIVTDDGFFHVLRIPLLQGRMFTRTETLERRDVVLINQALAKKYFPGQNPVGRKITIDMRQVNTPSTIIGIVGNVKQERLEAPPDPAVYWPYPELAYSFMTVVIQTEGKPLDVAPIATTTIRQIDPDQPLADIRSLDDLLGDSTARAQFHMTLLAILSGVALVLAVAGIYGVMSHAVLQRKQEFGIRMAIGADKFDLFKLVFKQGSRIVCIGAIAGSAGALALTRLLKSLLYETSTTDPTIMIVVVLILVIAGLFGCWIPSRRAAATSPLEALRYE